MVKEVIKLIKKVIRYLGKNSYIPSEWVNSSTFILYLCSRDKIDYDKIPHKEDYIDFITQGRTSKWRMTFCKLRKFFKKNNNPYGYSNGKKTPTKDGLKTKKP